MFNRNFVGWISILAVAIIVAVVMIWFLFIQPKEKVISGLSYYDFPIIVELDGHEPIEVGPFDNYFVKIRTDGEVSLKILRADNREILHTKRYDLNKNAAVAVEVIAPDAEVKDNEFCLYQADVTEMYYLPVGVDVSSDEYEGKIKSIQKLSEGPVSKFIYDLGDFGIVGDLYIYPGRYRVDQLPQTIEDDRSITGFFPLDCKQASSDEEIKEQIYMWRYFEEGALTEQELEPLLSEDSIE